MKAQQAQMIWHPQLRVRSVSALVTVTTATLTLCAAVWAHGQGSLVWQSGPDLPSTRAEAVAVLASDNAVVLMGGTSPSGNQVVPRLSDGALNWTTAPNLDITRIAPGAARYGASGILVFGGRNGTAPTDESLMYDYYTGDSQDADQMSTPRQQCASASDDGTQVFAIGGLNDSGQTLASAEVYDSAQNTWSGIAPLPAARYGATAASVDGTDLYVFGGATTAGVQATAWHYSIADDTWQAIPSLPVGVRSAVAVYFGDRIYVTGGLSSTGAVALVQVYDLSSGLWSMDTPLPAARYGHAAVIGAQSQLVIAGGYAAGGAASSSVWQSQRLDIPETAPVFNSSPVVSGSLDHFYSYDASATANPPPTFSLVSAPAGMTIDATTGLINWQPVAGQSGNQSVTLRATNRVGFADQVFNINVLFDTIAPTAPTNVEVIAVTANSVDLNWSGASDANGIHHYNVYRQYHCGFHGIQRCYALVQGNIPGTTTTITGLPPLTSYIYTVRAYDSSGNQSPNSKLVSFKTLSPPVSLRAIGATTLPANFPLQLQFYVNANPAATFSIVSGPRALTLDPDTGVATWTPTPADVGTHTLTVRATNSGGTADLSVTITVNLDAPQISVQFIPGAGGARDAVAGSPYSAKINDGSHTTSTFALVSAPVGMTIDAATGLISWLPTPDNAGQQSVTVRATNAASSVNIVFEFYCHFTGAPTNILVTGLTDLVPTATWSPPTGTGADRVVGYTISARARYRSGRTMRSHVVNYETTAAETSVPLTGLVSGRTYNLYVNAFDDADNRGLANSNGVAFVSRPALPSVSWAITNLNGGVNVIAGQEARITLAELNPIYGPTSYAVVSAPTGFSLNPVTGEGHWTPGAVDVGAASIVIRATNQIGPKDITINFTVYFSGSVRNVVATQSGGSALVSWQPPTDNVFPVVTNRVTMHWQVGSRSYSRTMTTTGNSLSFGLTPTGAVWHKGVTITPLNALGHAGVTTPLIPYNGALPVGMPAPEMAWIEQLTVSPTGTPVVEIRGLSGAAVDLQVSGDISVWDPVNSLIIGEEGVIQYPDTEAQNVQRGFYRVTPTPAPEP